MTYGGDSGSGIRTANLIFKVKDDWYKISI